MPIKYTVNTKIKYNGKEYSRVEDMPPEARQAFEQAMGRAQQDNNQVLVQNSSKVVFNGQEYASRADMPAEVRGQYDKVMDLVDADHNGVPDMLEKDGAAAGSSGWSPTPADTLTPSAPIIPAQNKPAKPGLNKMVVAAIFIVLALVMLKVLVILVQGGLALK